MCKSYKACHHVVYSVKGGCGKTTFSLRLLLTDWLRENQKGVDGEKKSDDGLEINYFFDMDFLGTSLLSALDPGDDNGLDNPPALDAPLGANSDYILMNDLIFNTADVRDLPRKSNSINKDDKKDKKDDKTVRYVIPSSCHEKDKELFHVKRRNTPLLRYDEFRHEMAGIVSKIKLVESSNRDGKEPFVINFIYDMPPNADGYTEALFDYLLECAARGENVSLYLVYNSNATLTCDLEWLEVFLSSGRMTDNIKIYFVNNEISKFPESDSKKPKEIDESVIDGMAERYHIKDICDTSSIPMKFSGKVVRFNYGAANSEDRVELTDLFVDD